MCIFYAVYINERECKMYELYKFIQKLCNSFVLYFLEFCSLKVN